MAEAQRVYAGQRSPTEGTEEKAAALSARARATLGRMTLAEAYGALVAKGVARGALKDVGEVRALYAIAADLELQTFGATDRRSGSGRLDARALNAWAEKAASIVREALLNP